MRSIHKWTPEDDAVLAKLRNEGYSASAIGKVIGVSRNAVIGRASRLKLAVTQVERIKLVPKTKTAAPVKKNIECGAVKAVEDLTYDSCRYPMGGHPQEKSFYFCGEAKKSGSSYCAKHHNLCYYPARLHKVMRGKEIGIVT